MKLFVWETTNRRSETDLLYVIASSLEEARTFACSVICDYSVRDFSQDPVLVTDLPVAVLGKTILSVNYLLTRR